MRGNILALYTLLQHLKLYIFNCTIITYRNFITWKCDKDRSTENETVIPVVNKFL